MENMNNLTPETTVEDSPSTPIPEVDAQNGTDTPPMATGEVLDAQLSELKRQAKKRNAPVGPAARPGRFNPLRPGSMHSTDGAIRPTDNATEARKKAMAEIYQSYLNKRCLSGTVCGVKPAFEREARPGEKMLYYVIVPYGPFQVYIPADKFADVDMEELAERYRRNDPSKTASDAERIYLQSRIGAEVDFVITNLPEDDEFDVGTKAGGARVEAMYRQRVRFWFGTTTINTPLVNIGDRAKARIVAVSRAGIRVEIFGVETFIPNRELSWTLIQDARLKFNTGDEREVIIKDIQRDMDNDYHVEFEASVKLADPDPRDKGLALFADGGVYSGTINYVRIPDFDSPHPQRPAVFVAMDGCPGVQCMCPFPNGSIPPQEGSRVHVSITNHNDERKQLFGRIYHISPN